MSTWSNTFVDNLYDSGNECADEKPAVAKQHATAKAREAHSSAHHVADRQPGKFAANHQVYCSERDASDGPRSRPPALVAPSVSHCVTRTPSQPPALVAPSVSDCVTRTPSQPAALVAPSVSHASNVTQFRPPEPDPSVSHETGVVVLSQGPHLTDWHEFEVRMHRDNRWWEWRSGIIDSRLLHPDKPRASEGSKLSNAYKRCEWVLKKHKCEYKIGMARSLACRWRLYQEPETRWNPTHMFIVLQARGREAVGYAEAALIVMMDDCETFDLSDNINHRNNDLGGTGPRLWGQENDDFFVYLAVKRCRGCSSEA